MPEITVCKNCKSENIDNYCSNCGQKVHSERFTLKNYFAVFLETFNIEKGFFYTTKMLLINPGKIIREYLGGRTKIYFNPLKFFLIIAAINAAIMIYFDIFDQNVMRNSQFAGADENAQQLAQSLAEFFKKYLHIIGVLILPFYSLISKIFFRKAKLNYAEHLIINIYFAGELAIAAFFLNFFYYFIPALFDYSLLITFGLIAFYFTYGFSEVFKVSKLKAFMGGLIVNYFGQLLFILFFVGIFLLSLIVLKSFGFSPKELLHLK